MKILIAPNAFKGSLSVLEACRAMAAGVKSVLPDAELDLMPISDGGDGLIEALLACKGGRLVPVSVLGPLCERRTAHFAWLPGKVAVVEMARASGLALVPPQKRDVLRATSFGTGQLIDAALKKGARTILVGMGGSASNDGGAGMAQALGARLFDAFGRDLALHAEALLRLERADLGGLERRLWCVRVIAVSDVTNPLLGPKGSARTYGPQKGATRAQVRTLEKALTRYAMILKRDLGADVAKRPGAGAAGGLGAGLLAFLNAKLVPGASFVLEELGARRRLSGASAALTGEGRLDKTSFFGKAPVEFSRLARAAGVPTAFVCGASEPSIRKRMTCPVSLEDAGAKGGGAMRRAAFWTKKAAALAVKRLLLAGLLMGLACVSRAASSEDFAAIDQLYFHRDQGKNLDESVAKLEALLKEEPENPKVLWRLGRSLMRAGEKLSKKKDRIEAFERAEGIVRQSVALEPRDPDAHFWLGVTMGKRGQARGIMNSLFMIGPLKKEMLTVLELDPKYGGAHHVLGEFYSQLPGLVGGSKKKALAEFEQALALSPDYAVNYPSLAEAYIDAGKKDKAREVLDRLYSLKNPTDPAEFPDNLKDGKELEARLKP
ncbi:MAG: glycerate kinase [Elusimicrobia bacterium]|nr:glycerate kinase [Elusimicrobiota bacterium]